ncbi:UNVERIFIED_ORG: hypothetical protein FHW05_004707 [Pantoea agglomerans]
MMLIYLEESFTENFNSIQLNTEIVSINKLNIIELQPACTIKPAQSYEERPAYRKRGEVRTKVGVIISHDEHSEFSKARQKLAITEQIMTVIYQCQIIAFCSAVQLMRVLRSWQHPP